MKIGISLPVRELKHDLSAIKDFAQAADELGLTHLRVPDQVARPDSGHLHDPITLLAYIAAVTNRIELVPSVIVLPVRQTVLVARQSAGLDQLSGGRLRLGIGVGKSPEEYRALGMNFSDRGARCEEQIALLRELWSQPSVDFEGKWDTVKGVGIDPRPAQPIPLWIGASANPSKRIIRRIGQQADGWFVLCSPDEFPTIHAGIGDAARAAGRDPSTIGTEAGVAVVGPREAEWQDRVRGWRAAGLTHLCLRTLGGDLAPDKHLPKMREVVGIVSDQIPLS